MIKKTFKVEDMTCTNCAMKLESLEDTLEGVKEINASYHKLEMVIEYDESKLSDEDVADPLAGGGRQDRLEMVVHVGAGVDHRDLAVADDVGAGAHEGERAGVVGHDTTDQRRQTIAGAVVEGDVPNEGDHARPPAKSL